MNSLLDPFIVALPTLPANQQTLDEYAGAIETWSGSNKDKTHTIMFSLGLIECLAEVEQYPDYQNIKRMVARQNSVLTAYDIFQACERRINEKPYIEEKISESHNFTCDLSRSVVLPKKVEERLHPKVALVLKNIFANVAIAGELQKEKVAQDLIFATTGLSDPDNMVRVNSTIKSEETTETLDIRTGWRYVLHPDELDDLEPWENLWEHSQRALCRAYRQLCEEHALDSKVQKCPKPKIGKEFNTIIFENGFFNDESLMKALFKNTVLALIGTGGFERHKKAEHNKHHPLKSGFDQIHREDGATAWRVHLSGVHRLHYWLLPDGNAELSVVTGENHAQDYIV